MKRINQALKLLTDALLIVKESTCAVEEIMNTLLLQNKSAMDNRMRSVPATTIAELESLLKHPDIVKLNSFST